MSRKVTMYNEPTLDPLRPLFFLYVLIMAPLWVFVIWPVRLIVGLILTEVPTWFMDDEKQKYEYKLKSKKGEGIWKWF